MSISPDKQDIYDHDQRHRRPALHRDRRQARGRATSARKTSFKTLVTIKPGDAVPRRGAWPQTTRAFTDRFGTFGYAFANVDARPEIDRANGQVAFTLVVEPQRRVYVRRINIAGNTRTRDEVIRREIRQFEAPGTTAARSSSRATASTASATSARSTSRPPRCPGTTDQVDLTVTVKEKPTGNLLARRRLLVGRQARRSPRSIKQENIFGSGNYLGLEVNTSKYNRTLVAEHGRAVLHDRRHLARASTSTTAPAGRSTARARSTSSSRRASRCASACRSASTTRSSSASAPSAPRSSGDDTLPHSYFHLPRAVRRDQRLDPADDRLDARQPRQRAGADRRPLHARQPRLRAARRRQVPARQPAGPAVLPAHPRVHASASTPRSATARARRPAVPDLQELLRRRPRHGARLRAGLARPGRRRPAPTSAATGASTSTTSSTCRCRAPAPTGRCASSLYADAGNVWGENEKLDLRRACAPRPASASAGSRRSARSSSATARRSARSRTIESSGFSFRSGPPSDERASP